MYLLAGIELTAVDTMWAVVILILVTIGFVQTKGNTRD